MNETEKEGRKEERKMCIELERLFLRLGNDFIPTSFLFGAQPTQTERIESQISKMRSVV